MISDEVNQRANLNCMKEEVDSRRYLLLRGFKSMYEEEELAGAMLLRSIRTKRFSLC